jgi:GNAT superfamily N-acetyltransferase
VEGLKVRRAGPEDIGEIRHLLVSTGSAALATEVETALGDGRHVAVLAEQDTGGTVGFGLLRLMDAPTGGGRAGAEVRLLVVRDGWRGRGIGEALLEPLRRDAAAGGCPEVRISTRARRPSP